MARRSRILLCSTELSLLYPGGGVGTCLFQAARALAGSGRFDVDLLCEQDRYESGQWEKAVHSLKASGIGLLGYGRADAPESTTGDWVLARSERVHGRLRALQATAPYDLVEFAEWGAEGYCSMTRAAEFQSRPKFAVRLHSPSREIANANEEPISDDLMRLDSLECLCIEAADVVLSPSRFLIDWTERRDLHLRECAIRSPYPYGAIDLTADLTAVQTRREPGPCRVVYCGRLENRKGVTDLAMAVRRLRHPSALQLIFIGADTGRAPGGSMREYLSLALRDVCSATFLDPMYHPELFGWLVRHADILIVPSRWENYPNILLEAAQLPCGLVVSDAGGIPDLLEDYGLDDARRFTAGDVDSLAEQLESACLAASSADRAARADFADSSRRIMDRYCDLYARLCNGDRRR